VHTVVPADPAHGAVEPRNPPVRRLKENEILVLHQHIWPVQDPVGAERNRTPLNEPVDAQRNDRPRIARVNGSTPREPFSALSFVRQSFVRQSSTRSNNALVRARSNLDNREHGSARHFLNHGNTVGPWGPRQRCAERTETARFRPDRQKTYPLADPFLAAQGPTSEDSGAGRPGDGSLDARSVAKLHQLVAQIVGYPFATPDPHEMGMAHG